MEGATAAGGASGVRPLGRLLVYRIGVMPIRFALSGAGLAGAAAVGGGRGAGLAFGLGTVATIFVVLADPRHRLSGVSEPPAVPPGAEREEWWRTVLAATYPSTAGLAVLTGISIAFNSTLAAFLAGGLCGLGFAGLVLGAQVTVLEHRLGGCLVREQGYGRVFIERH